MNDLSSEWRKSGKSKKKEKEDFFGGLGSVDYFLQLNYTYLLKLTNLDSLKENTT